MDNVTTQLIYIMPKLCKKYRIGHWEEKQHCTHWSWHHAEELLIQPVDISKLPGWSHSQAVDELQQKKPRVHLCACRDDSSPDNKVEELNSDRLYVIDGFGYTIFLYGLEQGSGTYGSRAIYGSSGDGIWLPDNFELKNKYISARPPVIFSIAPDYSRSNLRSLS